MIRPEKALEIVLDREITVKSEELPLNDCFNRILAEDVVSGVELPPFNKSAMDGFAFTPSENYSKYRIIEDIAAGSVPEKDLGPSECSRIMTGAMVPNGATNVIRVEFTSESDGFMTISKPDEYVNICKVGENLKIGQSVLGKGTLIRPQEIATLACIGKNQVKVSKKPVIGVINTGSEIIEAGGTAGKGQIFNSNGPQLCAQINTMNVELKYYGIVQDEKELIRAIIKKAFSECDFILLSGGVSMGDYDFVPDVLKELGVLLHFEKVAIKPGKPTVFGDKDGKFFFGLPGNPVSTFVIFEYFVKPLIYKTMGYEHTPQIAKGKTNRDFFRKNSQRVEYVPVYFYGDKITLPDYHGSGHINIMTESNALICIEQGIHEIKKGTEIDVRFL
ncbi:molybdopterin molybdotransferase MoeA [bacterium]|nr:molybdopterin molybdotransferase MoeA [bacterium]